MSQKEALIMKESTFIALVSLVIGLLLHDTSAQPCQGNGFTGGCECNIMGGCNALGVPQPGLNAQMNGYAPSGIEQFGYASPLNKNNRALVHLCEGGTMAILYDCNAKIPLYAATVMTGSQIKATYSRPSVSFRPSGYSGLNVMFQQQDNDYDDVLNRNICYETQAGNLVVDKDWLNAHPKKPSARPSNPQPCVSPFNLPSPVHRGHLIAASYGRGIPNRPSETFRYTNSVPQFGTFNSGKWGASERRLLRWGQTNCNAYNGVATQTVRMYIVVGAIPSTLPTFQPRFFGEAGFGDSQSSSKLTNTYGANTGGLGKEYRINVPKYMWTAACCTFSYIDKHGKLVSGTRSTAFLRENEPGKDQCDVPGDLNVLFSFLKFPLQPIDLFPAEKSCYDVNNFVG